MDSLLDESRKRASEAAKARPPPSDGSESAASSGKKSKSSSSRNKGSRSNTTQQKSSGADKPCRGFDQTGSQNARVEQQQNFVYTGHTRQHINPGIASRYYLDDQQDESQKHTLFDSVTHIDQQDLVDTGGDAPEHIGPVPVPSISTVEASKTEISLE